MGSGGTSLFQIVILAIFGIFIVVGVLMFAAFGGFGGEENPIGEVTIWGTLGAQPFMNVLTSAGQDNEPLKGITYVQKSSGTYELELANALASGAGPDAFLISNESVLAQQGKLTPVPYETLGRQRFSELFIEAAEIFLADDGSLGVPVAVDPLVLYWNRDLLSSAGYANPPQYWNQVLDMAEQSTEKDNAGNVTRSVIAFGEYDNVQNAKAILSLLIQQAQGRIVAEGAEGDVRSFIGAQGNTVAQPTESALRFYTEFADPSGATYTWNRSLPLDRNAFTAGDLMLYIGFASEEPLIRAQNPNLNFAVALVPQIQTAERASTYGTVHAIAFPSAADNTAGAISAAYEIAGPTLAPQIAAIRGTPAPRRDTLSEPADGSDLIFRNSAIITQTWTDPDPEATDAIFERMIENVTTGALNLSESVDRADQELNALLEDLGY